VSQEIIPLMNSISKWNDDSNALLSGKMIQLVHDYRLPIPLDKSQVVIAALSGNAAEHVPDKSSVIGSRGLGHKLLGLFK